jgi:hypothetical protein
MNIKLRAGMLTICTLVQPHIYGVKLKHAQHIEKSLLSSRFNSYGTFEGSLTDFPSTAKPLNITKAKKYRKTTADLGKNRSLILETPLESDGLRINDEIRNKLNEFTRLRTPLVRRLVRSDSDDSDNTRTKKRWKRRAYITLAAIGTGILVTEKAYAEDRPDLNKVPTESTELPGNKPSLGKPEGQFNVTGAVAVVAIVAKTITAGVKKLFGSNERPQEEAKRELSSIEKEALGINDGPKENHQYFFGPDAGDNALEYLKQQQQKQSEGSKKQSTAPAELPKETLPEVIKHAESSEKAPHSNEKTIIIKHEEKSLGTKVVDKVMLPALGHGVEKIIDKAIDDLWDPVMNNAVWPIAKVIRTTTWSKYLNDTFDPKTAGRKEDELKELQEEYNTLIEFESSRPSAVKIKYALEQKAKELDEDFRQWNPETHQVEIKPDVVREIFRTEHPDISIDYKTNTIEKDGKKWHVSIDNVSHEFKLKEITSSPKRSSVRIVRDESFEASIYPEYDEYAKLKRPKDGSTVYNMGKNLVVKLPASFLATAAWMALFPVSIPAEIYSQTVHGTSATGKLIDKVDEKIDSFMGSSEHAVRDSDSDSLKERWKGKDNYEPMPGDKIMRSAIDNDTLTKVAASRGYKACDKHSMATDEIVFKKIDKFGFEKFIVFDREGTSGGHWKVYGDSAGKIRRGTYAKNLKKGL